MELRTSNRLLSVFSVPSLLLLSLVPSQCLATATTIGDALKKSEASRDKITCGTSNVSMSDTNFKSSLGASSRGEIKFDSQAYTCVSQITNTKGYTPHYQLKDGVKREGQIPDGNDLYFRSLIGGGLKGIYTFTRIGKSVAGALAYSAKPNGLALKSDLLLIGRCIPQVIPDSRLLSQELHGNPTGTSLTGSFETNEGHVEVVINPTRNYLIERAVFEHNGERQIVSIESYQEVQGVFFPKRVKLQVENASKVEYENTSDFSELRVNDGSIPELESLPPGQIIIGGDDNNIYMVDSNGKPFVFKHAGDRTTQSSLPGYIYIASLALLIFVASGYLINSIRARSKQRKA